MALPFFVYFNRGASPSFILKIRNTPLPPVRLEVDPGRADDRLPVKTLKDGLVEPQAPEVRGVEE